VFQTVVCGARSVHRLMNAFIHAHLLRWQCAHIRVDWSFSGKRSARLLWVWMASLSNVANCISVAGNPFSVLGLKH